MMIKESENAVKTEDKRLLIHTLGRFKVCRGETQLSAAYGRSRKIWDLFMFIITNRHRKLSPEYITDSLWPDQEYGSANDTVKNLIYRLRKQLTSNEQSENGSVIIYDQGCYCWNAAYPYWLDIEEFERLCSEARGITGTNPERATELFREALTYYRGDYLSENTGSDWLLPLRRYYHQKYVENLVLLLQTLKKLERYDQIMEECKKAILIEQFDEDIHLYYIEALINKEKIGQARDHYEYISSLFYRELGTKPSAALCSLYRTIQQKSGEAHTRLADIRDVLQERDSAEGALYCEPNYFYFLCKMERRRATREDRPIHLGLISITDSDYRLPAPEQIGVPMKTLKKVLSTGLRRGDVFSSWNEGQYVILLPGTNREQAELSLDRVSGKFTKETESDNLTLRASVHPLMPYEYF